MGRSTDRLVSVDAAATRVGAAATRSSIGAAFPPRFARLRSDVRIPRAAGAVTAWAHDAANWMRPVQARRPSFPRASPVTLRATSPTRRLRSAQAPRSFVSCGGAGTAAGAVFATDSRVAPSVSRPLGVLDCAGALSTRAWLFARSATLARMDVLACVRLVEAFRALDAVTVGGLAVCELCEGACALAASFRPTVAPTTGAELSRSFIDRASGGSLAASVVWRREVEAVCDWTAAKASRRPSASVKSPHRSARAR